LIMNNSLEKDLEYKLTMKNSQIEANQSIISDYFVKLQKLERVDIKYNNLQKEYDRMKQGMESELLMLSKVTHLTNEKEEEYRKEIILNTSNITQLETKIKEIIQENSLLEIKNNKLKSKYEELLEKFKTKTKEMKRNARVINKEYKDMLEQYNSKSKNVIDMYLYILFKKRKNRSHRNKCQTHLNNNCCVKKQRNDRKFFSLNLNSTIVEILKEIGLEDTVLFDEKNCCPTMSKLILKAITYLTKHTRSKAGLWYRNFLVLKNDKSMASILSEKIKFNNAIKKGDT